MEFSHDHIWGLHLHLRGIAGGRGSTGFVPIVIDFTPALRLPVQITVCPHSGETLGAHAKLDLPTRTRKYLGSFTITLCVINVDSKPTRMI